MTFPLKEDPWKDLREERAKRQAHRTSLGSVLMLVLIAGVGGAALGYVAGFLAASRSYGRGFSQQDTQADRDAAFRFKCHLGGAIGAVLGIGAAIRSVKDYEG